MIDFWAQCEIYTDFINLIICFAPAFCSMICAFILLFFAWDSGGSVEKKLRIASIIYFCTVGAVWLGLGSGSWLGTGLGSGSGSWLGRWSGLQLVSGARSETDTPLWVIILAAIVPLHEIPITYYIIRRQGCAPLPSPGDIGGQSGDNNRGRVDKIGDGQLSREMLESYFDSDRPYLDPDFLLSDLAGTMGVTRSEMSAFINRTYGMNFKRYVNRWRLAEYAKLMSRPDNKDKKPYKIIPLAGFSDSRHYQRALAQETQKPHETREPRKVRETGANKSSRKNDDPTTRQA